MRASKLKLNKCNKFHSQQRSFIKINIISILTRFKSLVPDTKPISNVKFKDEFIYYKKDIANIKG